MKPGSTIPGPSHFTNPDFMGVTYASLKGGGRLQMGIAANTINTPDGSFDHRTTKEVELSRKMTK